MVGVASSWWVWSHYTRACTLLLSVDVFYTIIILLMKGSSINYYYYKGVCPILLMGVSCIITDR